MKEEIFKRLDAIATKLGVATEHIWRVLTIQSRVDAIVCLLAICILILTCVGLTIVTRRWIEKYKNIPRDTDDFPIVGFLRVIPFVGYGITLIVLLASTNIIVTGFINPEYGAWIKLTELLK